MNQLRKFLSSVEGKDDNDDNDDNDEDNDEGISSCDESDNISTNDNGSDSDSDLSLDPPAASSLRGVSKNLRGTTPLLITGGKDGDGVTRRRGRDRDKLFGGDGDGAIFSKGLNGGIGTVESRGIPATAAAAAATPQAASAASVVKKDFQNKQNESKLTLDTAPATAATAGVSTSSALPSSSSSSMSLSFDDNPADYVSLLRSRYKNKVPNGETQTPSTSISISTSTNTNVNIKNTRQSTHGNYMNVHVNTNYESSDDEDDDEEEDYDDLKQLRLKTASAKNTTNINVNTNTKDLSKSKNKNINNSTKIEPTKTKTGIPSSPTSKTTAPILQSSGNSSSNMDSASYIAELRSKYKDTNTSKNKLPNRSFNSIIKKNLKQSKSGVRRGSGGTGRRSSNSYTMGQSNASSTNSDNINSYFANIGDLSNNSDGGGQNSNSLFANNNSFGQTIEEIYDDGSTGLGSGLGNMSTSTPTSTVEQTHFRPYSRSDRVGESSYGPKSKGGGVSGFGGLIGRVSGGSGGGGASTSTPNTFEREVIFPFEGSSMGDTMAAAAAVVRNGMRSQKHFKKGQKVLIALPVLNDEVVMTDGYGNPQQQQQQQQMARQGTKRPRLGSLGGFGDSASMPPQKAPPKPSVAPVNKFGYPKGEGKTAKQRQGPYVYVLATVKHIHFREDARHYTVERADTGVCVRADTGWMESLEMGSDAERAAFKASQIKELEPTSKGSFAFSNVSSFMKNNGIKTLFGCCAEAFSWMGAALKNQAAKIVSGSDPYRCEISITTVNFLVSCSLIVAFLDQAKHAFFSKDTDFALGVVLFIAWIILVVELIFQVFIRPKNYEELLKNEQAYNPSTVRYIDSFHLFFETLALLLAVPDFLSIFGIHAIVNSVDASIYATFGETIPRCILGYIYFFTTRLRLFCLVRYKRNHWINAYYFEKVDAVRTDIDLSTIVDRATTNPKKLIKRESNTSEDSPHEKGEGEDEENNEHDELLLKAAKIGTALLLVNSRRILIFMLSMTLVLPFIALATAGGPNRSIYEMTDYLHQINLAVPVSNPTDEDCYFFNISVNSWLKAHSFPTNELDVSFGEDHLVAQARLFPSRCLINGMVQSKELYPHECDNFPAGHEYTSICENWSNATIEEIEKILNVRQDSLVKVLYDTDDPEQRTTEVIYNLSHTVSLACLNSILLQFLMLVLMLLSLGYLRSDANKLVIMPLRRMLRIVLRYASNPLAVTPSKKRKGGIQTNGSVGNFGVFDLDFDSEKDKDKLGSYETEQLITVVTKITDLLRKCWGVAGAGIISSNLARNMKGDTVVFNPTVPGKLVYALFAFAGINDFGHLLRSLDKDVMTLINDIAVVIHNEVFRWGLGGSGQCNKNSGSSFLMVYRIGDFDEVRKKNDQAKKVIFAEDKLQPAKSSSTSSRALINSQQNSIQLASLPGINAFADRAVLGLLKSFAGINRAKSVKNWERDYRVGGGVGAFSVGMSFGINAGWAVEGAVGSGYKIDATYLSSNVNMASRMMSACKQYRLAILLSQAVEELLSKECRSKLRHVDTVYVKGSKDAQRIYTYDARQKGVPFFLNMRTDEQADKEANNYSPKIWRKDQDLQDMRSHISQEFISAYNMGLTQYLMGNWENAVVKLKEANEIMIVDVVAGGRIEFSALTKEKLLDHTTDDEDIIHMREEYGDGPCHALISYMENRNCIPPSDWNGVRPLTSK